MLYYWSRQMEEARAKKARLKEEERRREREEVERLERQRQQLHAGPTDRPTGRGV